MCKLNEMSTKKLSIKELLQSGDCDKEVEISGWVRTKRGNKQVNFIALNDGSTINNIQIVVDMNNISEELMKKVTTGAAIHVKGLLVKSEGSGQSHEIQAHELDVLGEADPDAMHQKMTDVSNERILKNIRYNLKSIVWNF